MGVALIVSSKDLFSYFDGKAAAFLTIAIAYTAFLFAFSFLTFPLKEDEIHYWTTVERFSTALIPSLEQLRHYPELSTPLPFVIFGQLEFLTGRGLILGRYLNFVLSLVMLSTIVYLAKNSLRFPVLLIAPLLVNPYLILTSNYLYTEMLATFFAFFGVLTYLQKKPFSSAVLFVLSISCRQYMLAFPVAIFVYEFNRQLQENTSGNLLDMAISLLCNRKLILMFIASMSIVFWIFLFDGLTPSPPRSRQTRFSSGISIPVSNALFFLTSTAIYFVVPEFILFYRRVRDQIVPRFRSYYLYVSVAGLCALLMVFPFSENMGYTERLGAFDWFLQLLDFPDSLRIFIFCCLAVFTLIRFYGVNFASIMLAVNTLLMVKAAATWEKYVLPLVIILFLLIALDKIDSCTLDLRKILDNLKRACKRKGRGGAR